VDTSSELYFYNGKAIDVCFVLFIKGAMISIQPFVRETRRRVESPIIGKGKAQVWVNVEYFTVTEHGEAC
jgi:hypothetical protein